jgi:hypothetical protein
MILLIISILLIGISISGMNASQVIDKDTFKNIQVDKESNVKKVVESKKLSVKPETLKIIYPKGRNTPSKVAMNSTHIYVYGFKCSCGRLGHYKPVKSIVFKNQCPTTKVWNVLKYNPKGVAEGEITSKRDMDFCLCGKEKWRPMRAQLKKW